MSEKKPVRREEVERKRRKLPTKPTENRKRTTNTQEPPKKRKPRTDEVYKGTKGKGKKSSGDRRPPTRSVNQTGASTKKRPPREGEIIRKRKRSPAKPPSKGKKLVSLIWDVIFYVFLISVLGSVVLFTFNDNSEKALFGYRLMTVLTNSMSPNKETTEYTNGFPSGSLVVVTKADPKSLKVGDIITFNPVEDDPDTYLTHRIVEVLTELNENEGLYFQTKGDANTGTDIPIKANQVVGKVIFSIPHVGNIMRFLRENIVVVAIFMVSLFALFAVMKYYLGMEEHRGNAPPKKKRAKKV